MPDVIESQLPPQIFQTVVLPPNSPFSVRFVCVPSRSIRPESTPDHLRILRDLELEPIATISPDSLKTTLAQYLAAIESRTESLFLRRPLEGSLFHPEYEAERYLDEAGLLLDTPLVPFEQSPLTAESLSRLAKGAGSTGMGAFLGFVLAGPTPLLLLTLPAGIILMSVTLGIARGIEKGLEKRVLGLISPTKPRAPRKKK